jgi:hypothetical protein
LDFKEFVFAFWSVCTLTVDTLPFFVFTLIDKDHAGYVTIDQVQQSINDLYGKVEDVGFVALS